MLNAPNFPEQLCQLVHFTEVWKRLIAAHSKSHGGKPYALLVLGYSGVGKTALAQEYFKAFPKRIENEKLIMPVLYVALTDTTTPKCLVQQLLGAMNVSDYNRANTLLQLQSRLLKLLQQHEVQMVIIDEVQECLPRAYGPARQKIIKLLSWLIDHSQLPFALFGTPIAKKLITFGDQNDEYKTEEQFSRRCYAPIDLKPIPPASNYWLEAVNFFMDKRNQPRFDATFEMHRAFLNRLYIATEGRIALLEKLMIHIPANQNFLDSRSRMTLAYAFHSTISNSKANPFRDEDFDDAQVEATIQILKEAFR